MIPPRAAASAPAPADENPPFACRRCGRHTRGEKADDAGWCAACRAWLIRASSSRAWVPAGVVAVGYLWLLWWSGLLATPLTAVWLAIGGVFVFVVYKVARRVFFDLLRGREPQDG
jgi:hypothetical protein